MSHSPCWWPIFNPSRQIAVVLLLLCSFFIIGAAFAEARPVPKTLFSRNHEVTIFFTAGLYIW